MGMSSLIRQLHNPSVVLKGEGHTNLVSGLLARSDGTLYSSGFDNQVRETLTIVADDTLFVVKINVIEAIRSNQQVFELKPKYSPSAIAVMRDIVAVSAEVSCLIENFSQSLCHGSCYAAIRIIWFTCIHGMGRH